MNTNVFIALGSNLNDPVAQVKQAMEAIATLPDCSLIKASPFYETKPMGFTEQNNFINAVVQIETMLSPFELLAALQGIEQAQGRVREFKNGPRTIDCDIILFGNDVINTPTLTVPHPGLTTRDFVLKPLLDIAPDCTLPNGQRLQSMI